MKGLQYKLIQGLIFSSTLPLIMVGVVTTFIIHKIALDDAHKAINNNLNMVESIYKNAHENLKYLVRDQNRRIFTLIELDQPALLRTIVEKNIKPDNLDFFMITNDRGRVIISMYYPRAEGVDLNSDLAVQKAEVGDITVSSEVLNEEQLKNLGLFERAAIPGVKPCQGLVIKAVLPIINREERIIGTMIAGYLLNNNRSLLAEIKKGVGLDSSVFLNDLRISSNVPSVKGDSIVGSRMHAEELSHILKIGKKHIGDVHIKGKDYLSGYTPIRNNDGKVIGSIGIAMPKSTVFALRNDLIRIFFFSVLFSMILAFVVGLIRGGVILASVVKLREATEAVSKGDFEHEIKINSHDEIEDLAKFFNNMTAQLKVFKDKLSQYSKGLEDKVTQRTAQLEAVNKQLIEYEKMAAMGRMATAISHELRNVFAGIQTVTYYLKSKINKGAPGIMDSIKDIEEEVIYATNIIDNVLRFSRPKKISLTDTDLNVILEDILSSLNLQETFKNNNIEIAKSLDSRIPKIKIDNVQIKEVILNLVINAVQSMRNGGKINIVTKKDGDFLRFQVSDTGSGISKEILTNLFVPFFTTKSKGLGLGLCICKDIIEAHRGKIQVQSELNKGSTFTVILPLVVPEQNLT